MAAPGHRFSAGRQWSARRCPDAGGLPGEPGENAVQVPGVPLLAVRPGHLEDQFQLQVRDSRQVVPLHGLHVGVPEQGLDQEPQVAGQQREVAPGRRRQAVSASMSRFSTISM